MLGNDLRNFVRYAAQIAIDDIAVDIEYGSDVVVAYGGRLRATDEGGHVAQNLDRLHPRRSRRSSARSTGVTLASPREKLGWG